MMTFIIFIGYDRKRKAERRRRPDDMFCNTCKSTPSYTFLETEKIVIQVASSDEDTDTATECSDYSDTDSADEDCLC